MYQSQVNQRNHFSVAPEKKNGVWTARRMGWFGQVECGNVCVLLEQLFEGFFLFRWEGLSGHERKAQRFEMIMKQHL